MTKITLDYPPSSNRYWRYGRGMIHRSHEANAYRDAVALICITAGIEPLEGDVGVVLHFYRPAKRGDLDNRIKIMLDCLQGYAYQNDSQVAEIHAVRRDDNKCPRVEVEVRAL